MAFQRYQWPVGTFDGIMTAFLQKQTISWQPLPCRQCKTPRNCGNVSQKPIKEQTHLLYFLQTPGADEYLGPEFGKVSGTEIFLHFQMPLSLPILDWRLSLKRVYWTCAGWWSWYTRHAYTQHGQRSDNRHSCSVWPLAFWFRLMLRL